MPACGAEPAHTGPEVTYPPTPGDRERRTRAHGAGSTEHLPAARTEEPNPAHEGGSRSR